MDIHGFPAGTFILNMVVGLVALYLFYTAVVRFFGRGCSWGQVAGKVNIALIVVLYLLVFGPFALGDGSSATGRILWPIAVVAFGLVALWNMLWITFTKEDISFFTPLAYGITLGIYVSLFIAFFFLDTA